MEVHGFPARNREPTRPGAVTAFSRFAVLALAVSIGGDAHRPPKPAAEPPDTVQSECDGCDDPSTLPSGTSLIGRRLLVRREGVRDLVVRVIRRNGAVELDVDGKAYGIQQTLGVAVGKKITGIEMRDGEVRIASEEYGVALVTRADVERVLGELADARSREVSAKVGARFTPQPNTVVAASMAAKRWYDGTREGETETFDVAFERTDAGTALASRD